MRTDDFDYVRRLHAPVPHPCRIHDYHRTFIAQSHAAAGSKLHIVVQAPRLYLAIERVKHSKRPAGCAGGNTFWFLLRANEKMKAERFHRGLRAQILESNLRAQLMLARYFQ
jgi:hypothetical protein